MLWQSRPFTNYCCLLFPTKVQLILGLRCNIDFLPSQLTSRLILKGKETTRISSKFLPLFMGTPNQFWFFYEQNCWWVRGQTVKCWNWERNILVRVQALKGDKNSYQQVWSNLFSWLLHILRWIFMLMAG